MYWDHELSPGSAGIPARVSNRSQTRGQDARAPRRLHREPRSFLNAQWDREPPHTPQPAEDSPSPPREERAGERRPFSGHFLFHFVFHFVAYPFRFFTAPESLLRQSERQSEPTS